MSAYIHGNLAVNKPPRERYRTEVTTRKVIKKASIPSTEKLLYLFTILIFVIVGGILLSRVAESYENNYKIQEMQKQIHSLKEDSATLQIEVSKLRAPERIIHIAQTELGMVQSESQVHLNESPAPAETASR